MLAAAAAEINLTVVMSDDLIMQGQLRLADPHLVLCLLPRRPWHHTFLALCSG